MNRRYPKRYIIPVSTKTGTLLKVPVENGPSPKYAIVEGHVWDELVKLELNPRLKIDKGHVCTYCIRPHRYYPLGYLIMDCTTDDLISYRDGDIFNLRKENLVVNTPINETRRYRNMLGRGKWVTTMFSVDYANLEHG